jgi:hypothetical protein
LYQKVAIWTINLLILAVIVDLIITHFFWFRTNIVRSFQVAIWIVNLPIHH